MNVNEQVNEDLDQICREIYSAWSKAVAARGFCSRAALAAMLSEVADDLQTMADGIEAYVMGSDETKQEEPA